MPQSILNTLPNPSVQSAVHTAAPVVSQPAFDPLNPTTAVQPPAHVPFQLADNTNLLPVQPAVQSVVAQPTSTVDDQWLTNLITGQPNPSTVTQPVQQLQPVQQPTQGLPDLNVVVPQAPVVEFIPSNQGLPTVLAGQPAVPQPQSSQMDEMMKIITGLQNTQTQNTTDTALEKQIEDRLAEVTAQYGSVDPKLATEFADVISTMRASLGTEFAGEYVRQNLVTEQKIAALTAQLEVLSKAPNAQPAGQQSTEAATTMYRNMVAQSVPDYNQITQHPYFKGLMATDVDPHNPGYTYNHKLGTMLTTQSTQDIFTFFNDVRAKIVPQSVQTNAVVDSGIPPANNINTTPSSTPNMISDIFKKVMTGELQVSEADMLRLRQMAAKQHMVNN